MANMTLDDQEVFVTAVIEDWSLTSRWYEWGERWPVFQDVSRSVELELEDGSRIEGRLSIVRSWYDPEAGEDRHLFRVFVTGPQMPKKPVAGWVYFADHVKFRFLPSVLPGLRHDF